MRRSIYLWILLLLVICAWSLGPATQEAKALKIITLTSPADSAKQTDPLPTFGWQVSGGTAQEVITRFHIKLADDPFMINPIWEDDGIPGTARSMDYPGAPSLVEWTAYYWTMRAEIDTGQVYWQDFTPASRFFYSTDVVIEIPTNLPTIQEGIVWAAKGDTVLVKEGTYYENLRVYKDSLVVISDGLFEQGSPDTTVINRTIIDGSSLTRGADFGSTIYFTPGVDSSSSIKGFTIRGGTGSKTKVGLEIRTSGGGIFCDDGSSPTIAYNVITGNQVQHDGGGIYVNSAAPNILHNIIADNVAVEGEGGAIECRFSIEVEAAPGLKQGKEETGTSQKAAPGSRPDASEEQIKNSLNPRDGTDVAAAPQNDPPVPVVTWFARRDTIIHRDKYLVGDTLFFDGTGSYDPDPSDSIRFTWFLRRHYQCWRPIPTFREKVSDTTYILPITNSQTGLLDVHFLLSDYTVSSFSDTITVSAQHPPYADAGDAVIGPPQDTLWLNGIESCDVNPDDALQYSWTNLSGPKPVSIQNPDSAVAYFIPEDPTYYGTYQFRLRVSDSMDADSADLQVTVDQHPVPVCESDPVYGDTIVGFPPYDPNDHQNTYWNLRLDGCASYDPDSAEGDYVKYYRWYPLWLFYTDDSGGTDSIRVFSIVQKNYLCTQPSHYDFGGLLKVCLSVEDSRGDTSEVYDTVYLSIQQLPVANAGMDIIVRPGEKAYLYGRAFDINPDQRNSMEFTWRWITLPPVTKPAIKPSSTDDTVNFVVPVSGTYVLALTVDDGYGISEKDDQVTVVGNQAPQAYVVNIDHAFEGDTVYLDGSSSYDMDSSTFQHEDSTHGGPLDFTWNVKSYPAGAQMPNIVNPKRRIAKFVPYAAGTYQFRLLVNDTMSVYQPADSVRTATGTDTLANIRFLTVKVDSTYAYPFIQGNLIYGNSSGSKGGAIDCNGSSPDIFSNVFYKNQSKLSGGAICARNFSTPQMKRNVFFGNISQNSTGGAIANLGALAAPSATRGFRKNMAVQENDFWDNSGGTLYQASGNISANIDTFPRFYDPDFGDFSYECGSPCLPDIGKLEFFPECVTADRLHMVALSLFQNPVATAATHFVVNTDVPLKGYPVGYVTIGGNAPSPIYFSPIASKSFRGSFVFTASGSAEVSIFASSLLERDTVVVNTMSVQLIGAGKTGSLVSVDGKVGVLFAKGSVKEEVYATCISVSKNSRYEFEGDPDAEAFGDPYQLGPSISFDEDLTVSFSLDRFDTEGKDKTLFSIYRFQDGEWNRLESHPDGDRICAQAKTLGVFRLVYDPNAKPFTNIPKSYRLFQNYPNPFNPETQIKYDLPLSGNVTLSVYNVLGRKVRDLVDGFQDAGRKSVTWDGRDDDGREAASGIYFYKIKAEDYQMTMKMVLLK